MTFSKLESILLTLDRSQQLDEYPYVTTQAGIAIDVFKGVFSPAFFPDSAFFAENLPDVRGLSILEIGTGTGLISIKCAFNGARLVVATDVNRIAVQNTRHNVKKFGLDSIVDVREGHIFAPVNGEKFDLIFWNVPFCYVADSESENPDRISEDKMLLNSVLNPRYELLTEYLTCGFDHLRVGGRLVLGFSPTIGHMETLDRIAEEYGVKSTVVFEKGIEFAGKIDVLQILEFER